MTALGPPMTNGHEPGENPEHSPNRFTAVNGRDSSVGNKPSIPDRGPETYSLDSTQRYEPQRNLARDHGQGRRSSRSASPDAVSKYKRKRSESRGQDSTYPEGVNNHSPGTRAAELQHVRLIGSAAGSGADVDRGNHSATPSHRSEGNEVGHTSANSPWSEYDSQLITQAQRAQQIDASDAHLADALQREAGHERSTPGAHQASSPGYGPDRHGALQVAPKRKRVFSNRTKTGCMTCRRRKKKCDEQHPACNNCLRGGFQCEGYSSRSTWQKPSSTKTPVPLQSKEGYSDISGPYMQDSARYQDRQPSATEQVDTPKIRTLGTEGHGRHGQPYRTSPTVTASNPGWPKQPWPNAGTGPLLYSESGSRVNDREVPSIHELSQESRPKQHYGLMREPSLPTHNKTTLSLFQGGVEQRTLPPAAGDTYSPRSQAQLALGIEHQLSGRAVPAEETEKQKMITGQLYRPFDVQLVGDRDTCRKALWKFNNACNPLLGISPKDQTRLLKEIIVPPVSPGASRSLGSVGSIGQGVIVEAPFTCHYGYNIHLGEDVMISENCLFVDDCVIRVGAHTWIGPNVRVLSSAAHESMQERKGSQSRYQGVPVTIEEDCYVGAGCTIYPGVHLGRGAYVAPGEIVRSHISAYQAQGPKPRVEVKN